MLNKKIKLPFEVFISSDLEYDELIDLTLEIDEMGVIRKYTIDDESIEDIFRRIDEALDDILSDYPNWEDEIFDSEEEEDEYWSRISAVQDPFQVRGDVYPYTDAIIGALAGNRWDYKTLVDALRKEGIEINEDEV